jgi:hypothetical protein
MPRQEMDFYPTPDYATQVLLEEARIPEVHLLEPCVGDGSIISVFRREGLRNLWFGSDLVERQFVDNGKPDYHEPGSVDYREWNISDSDSVTQALVGVVSNPPYNQAFEIAQWFVARHSFVALLLRATFAGSEKRNAWLRATRPSVHVVPRRLHQFGSSDTVERHWYVWQRGAEPTFSIGRYIK